MKYWLSVLVVVLVLLLAAAGYAAYDYQRFLDTPMPLAADGDVVIVAPGSSFGAVAAELAARGLIARPTWYRLYARLTDAAASIHAGEYELRPGTSPRAFLEQMTAGEVRLYSFTIVEGWNRWDLLRALAADPVLEATLSDEDWPRLLAELGSNYDNPEGLFLPETYRFPRGTSDAELLGEAYRAMLKVLDDEWSQRADDAPVNTQYEALILASIIEKETARADERPLIAGVFARRLARRMRLQTDPTVIYGLLPEFDGNLTRRNLRSDTPYNTYTRGGLPPTPIAMPGRDAIRAALNPADGETLYFVATGLGDGSHAFSATKEEHDAAVQDYLRRLRGGSGGGDKP